MRKINRIILHHSASPAKTTTPELVKKWHIAKGFKDVGYHWMIDVQGELHKGRKESVMGAHCKGHNRDSIGVCVFGNFEEEEVSYLQAYARNNLLFYLMRKYSIPHHNIVSHNELGKTLCPGKNFDW